MNKLVILIGNIASGKTTISKQYAKEGYVVVSRDALRYMIGAGSYVFNTKLETAIKSSNLLIINEFCKLSSNILVDECCVTKKLRKSIIDVAKKYDYRIIAVCMPRISMDESVERRTKDPHGSSSRKLWEDVWTNFDCAYEKPELSEGFDNILTLS